MSSPASFRSWENLVYHVISPISATRMAASVPPTPGRLSRRTADGSEQGNVHGVRAVTWRQTA